MSHPVGNPPADSVVPISSCRRGQRVVITGRLGMVTVSPQKAPSNVTAYCYDDTGQIKIVWLGRRTIAGLTVGQSIEIHGRVSVHGRELAIYNPSYELIA